MNRHALMMSFAGPTRIRQVRHEIRDREPAGASSPLARTSGRPKDPAIPIHAMDMEGVPAAGVMNRRRCCRSSDLEDWSPSPHTAGPGQGAGVDWVDGGFV